jgi:hypothetical protein
MNPTIRKPFPNSQWSEDPWAGQLHGSIIPSL